MSSVFTIPCEAGTCDVHHILLARYMVTGLANPSQVNGDCVNIIFFGILNLKNISQENTALGMICDETSVEEESYIP